MHEEISDQAWMRGIASLIMVLLILAGLRLEARSFFPAHPPKRLR